MNFQLLLCISCSRRFRSVPSETPSCNTLYHTLLPFAQWQIFLVSSLKSLSRNHWILIEELHCRRNCLAAWKWSTSNSPFTWSLKTVPASRYQAAGPWGLAQTWKKNVRPWSYGAKWGEWDDLWSYGLDHSPFPKPFQHQSSSIIHHPQWENLRRLSVHGLVHWAWSLKYCRCGNMAQSVYLDQKMARLVQRSGRLGWNQHTQWGFQVMTSTKLK